MKDIPVYDWDRLWKNRQPEAVEEGPADSELAVLKERFAKQETDAAEIKQSLQKLLARIGFTIILDTSFPPFTPFLCVHQCLSTALPYLRPLI